MSGGVSSAPPQDIPIVLLAAVADNGVIGRDNALPFRQGADLKRFKTLTMGKPVVMGRKTYLSIGKPLAGRTNIVISRDVGFAPEGLVVARSLDAALAAARDDARKRGAGEIVVIGGTEIFAQTMPLADRMEITHVHARPEGDTYYPPIDRTHWRAVARSDHPAGPRDDSAFSYVTYVRA
jgi:dihydrofolate reductase